MTSKGFGSYCTNNDECENELGLSCNNQSSTCNYPFQFNENFCDCDKNSFFDKSLFRCGKLFFFIFQIEKFFK